MRIRVYIETGCVGCHLHRDIDVDDDADDEELVEAARYVLEESLLQWGWHRLDSTQESED